MIKKVEEVRSVVASWLSKTEFKDAYIFGSLVHKGGVQFELKRSDVDLICLFPDNCSYLERCEIITKAFQPTANLNLELLSLFGRIDASRPIVSVVSVGSLELQAGLHKDKSAQFFSHNEFVSVITGKRGPIGKEHVTPEATIDGALDSIRGAQRLRNKALAITPSQSCDLSDYDDVDPLPKDIARSAAQTRWALIKNLPDFDRFDVNEGMMYMLQLLASRRNEAPEVNDLLTRLLIRMNGRGQSSPLSASDQILLSEILAEDAFALIKVEDTIPITSVLPMRTTIQPKVREQAMIRAGFKCSFPGCGVPLGTSGIGVVAHIQSPSAGGPRYNASLKAENAGKLENLIVLCPTHLRMIDSHVQDYSADLIKSWNVIAASQPIHTEFSSDNLFTMLSIINRLSTPGAEPGVAGEHDQCPACERRMLEFRHYGVGPFGVSNAWYVCKSCGYQFQTRECSED